MDSLRCVLALVITTIITAPLAAQNWDSVQVHAVPVARSIYMLTGSGGNIGLSAGTDGAFLVDDQYAPLTDKIVATIRSVTDEPVHFVVNTHWHGDHTGGNENLGATGALIVAHENVRQRMSTEQFIEAFNARTPPSPAAALPVITFTESVTFHWNGDEIHVFHVHPAHTDGDAIIHFRRANVIHMGDTFFNGIYPFIDVSSGGNIHGMIAAADQALGLAGPDTRIIPGHGPLATTQDLTAYRDMLVDVRNRVAALIADGKTRDEAVASKSLTHLDAKWGGGFMQPDVFVGIVYDSMTR